MKAKIVFIFLALCLLIGGFNIVGIDEGKKMLREENEIVHDEMLKQEITFSPPSIEESNDYAYIAINECNSFIVKPGYPLLPKMVKRIEIPYGARNISVEVNIEGGKEYEIQRKIVPSPARIRISDGKVMEGMNREIYKNINTFPEKWYSYHIGVGLNNYGERVIHVVVSIYPVKYIPSLQKIIVAKIANIEIGYDIAQENIEGDAYELLIVAPSEFRDVLQSLVEHKNDIGVPTILKTTDEIYASYDGRDEPEKIKYAIKDAIEEYGIKYVLLVGGLKSKIYAKPKDNANAGIKGWYLPVRYSNCRYWEGDDPGFITDLYYADIYKYEDGNIVFDDWDSNGNGIFAEFTQYTRDILDLYPDVYVGRLPCRNLKEVEDVVSKIIAYEIEDKEEWFYRIIGVTGDGFLDQEDLNITWDVSNVPDGSYTLYAQSINDEGDAGPVDITHFVIDHNAKTKLTFNHDDYLIPEIQNGYPAPPIAKIVSISEGDVVGRDDYTYSPSEREAYLNYYTHWADVEYVNGILYIRGKSYDPKLYGDYTNIHVWIENENGEIVFSAWRNNTIQIAEGDWTVGEKLLHERGGAFYYMPDSFEKIFLSTSNGNFTGKQDVVDALSKGAGFVFFSGHGSPGVWANHYPGIPGNRQHAEIIGLSVSDLEGKPHFPMDAISNEGKPFICVVGGCHNNQFNISVVLTSIDWFNRRYMNTFGYPVPECWSWYIVKQPNKGAIASIGNTGYGYGNLGEWCVIGGVDNWITTEFFRVYAEESLSTLGNVYAGAISNYITHFHEFVMPDVHEGWDAGDLKTVQQWVLFGDPSLQLLSS
ncbi:MAG TPA: peptidase C25 [Thermoplasmatales archaeon]|nr:peptidase C25 [Thermoplasmatales archaeon]